MLVGIKSSELCNLFWCILLYSYTKLLSGRCLSKICLFGICVEWGIVRQRLTLLFPIVWDQIIKLASDYIKGCCLKHSKFQSIRKKKVVSLGRTLNCEQRLKEPFTCNWGYSLYSCTFCPLSFSPNICGFVLENTAIRIVLEGGGVSITTVRFNLNMP